MFPLCARQLCASSWRQGIGVIGELVTELFVSPISAIPPGADLSCPIPQYFSLSSSSGGPSCSSTILPPWRTPAAWLEDPWGSPWDASSPDLPLSLIIATCSAALQQRLVMKGCRKALIVLSTTLNHSYSDET